MKRRNVMLLSVVCFGYAFLYGPILWLIVYSFNESKVVTVWTGFSTRWYAELLRDEQVLGAAWVSLQIAFINHCFAGMIAAPLVMPEIITGLSLLLLFVTLEDLIGWPAGRGMTTITIAHITFSMAYVAVIVQSRLSDLDGSLEEAALDLGAKPAKVFFLITIPVIAPALVAGWLLAFTLSLDDLVIASFVAGPGSSTLPMVVFSKVRLGLEPTINALATIIILIVSLGIIAAALIARRQQDQQIKDQQQALSGD